MARLVPRELSEEEAHAIAAWRYPAPYERYDMRDGAVEVLLRRDKGSGYYPVLEGDELVGFVCFGAEARVRGQQEEAATTDIGMGVAPDHVSRGIGAEVLRQAITFAQDHFHASRLRVAVAAFNERSLRLCASAGFVEHRHFDGVAGDPFVELVRPAEIDAALS